VASVTGPADTPAPPPRHTPTSLDQLRAITNDADRARAVRAYVEEHLEHLRSDALLIRDDAIRSLHAHHHRPTEIADMTGYSLSTVKNATRETRRARTTTPAPPEKRTPKSPHQ
jgi:hypothetical protein